MPDQVRYNLPIEFLYTVVPFIMIGVLFYFTVRDENYIDKLSPHPDVIVNVTGFQWSWEFQYPQYKVHAEAGYVTELGPQWNGVMPGNKASCRSWRSPPARRSGSTSPRPTSSTRSGSSPFEFKRDVMPDHPNHFEVTPTKTGTFTGRCTELCGVYHSRMLFTVKIVTPAAVPHVDRAAAGAAKRIWGYSVTTIDQPAARSPRRPATARARSSPTGCRPPTTRSSATCT